MNSTASIVSKVWSFCDILRDDGVGYGDYLEQLTYRTSLRREPLYVPIYEPMGIERPETISRWVWLSVVRAPSAVQEIRSAMYCGVNEGKYLGGEFSDTVAEARLLYVAMTRAIEVLVLRCDRRSVFAERLEGALGKVG